jgi:hypothetical protein
LAALLAFRLGCARERKPEAASLAPHGICIVFEFEQIDEHGNWAWLVYGDVLAPGRLYELRAVMGEKVFGEL